MDIIWSLIWSFVIFNWSKKWMSIWFLIVWKVKIVRKGLWATKRRWRANDDLGVDESWLRWRWEYLHWVKVPSRTMRSHILDWIKPLFDCMMKWLEAWLELKVTYSSWQCSSRRDKTVATLKYWRLKVELMKELKLKWSEFWFLFNLDFTGMQYY